MLRAARALVPLVSVPLALPASAGDVYVDQNAASCASGTGGVADPVCTIGAGIALASPGDTVHVAPGTYLENVVIAKDLTIVGSAGEAFTIVDGGSSGIVVDVLVGVTVTIDGLTITNGSNPGAAGAGVRADQATTTLRNSTVSGSTSRTGGGIYARYGTMTLEDATVAGNTSMYEGAAVHAKGAVLTLTNTTVSGNTVTGSSAVVEVNYSGARLDMSGSTVTGNTSYGGYAAAIHLNGFAATDSYVCQSTISGNTMAVPGGVGGLGVNAGHTLILENSTISGNTGGGVWLYGLSNYTQIRNSTISGNTGGYMGGIFSFAADPYGNHHSVDFCTITGNSSAYAGGGVASVSNYGGGYPGSVVLNDSIVAGNSAPSDPDVSGDFPNSGGNLIGIVGAATGLSGPLVGTISNPVDPMIQSLQINGGQTATHALLTGSPAIDAGGASSLTRDQRGVTRPTGAANDLGAYEFVAQSSYMTFGAGTSGSGGFVPLLVGAGDTPAPGASIRFDAFSVLGGAAGFLGVGVELGVPIPLYGGNLYTLPKLFFFTPVSGPVGVAGAGTSSFPTKLPNDLTLIGLSLAVQGGYFDPAAVQGIALSNGLRVTIG